MASRIIAQLLVTGGAILGRAVAQAWQQAVANGRRAGVDEAVRNVARGKQMTIEEARMILGVQPNATLKQVHERFEHLFKANEKGGSFYLQSKVYRAKECIEAEALGEAQSGEQGGGAGTGAGSQPPGSSGNGL